jgi:rhamnogalacturonan endolyase
MAFHRKLARRIQPRLRLGVEELEDRRLLAFGMTTTSSSYTVDTGGGVVFSILRGGTISSTVHLGDMTSAQYNGTETLASYASSSRYSHYEQGLSSTAIISATIDPSATPQWIKITCDDSVVSGVIHYYVAKRNDPNIYMASNITDLSLGPGEGRYIAYMNKSVFTNIEQPSNISNNVGAVEGSDVFYNADGTTASKFYNMGRRIIDNTYHGITGTSIGAYMFMGNREKSSGGPFFKDIDFQTTSGATEMYNVVFSGHTQTEAYRGGLQGPYAMQFTNGALPTTPNYTFLEGVGIVGLVPTTGRGTLTGTATGMVSGHQTVIGLSNTTGQYWAYADASTGAFNISGVLPGTYTMTMYDTELAVGTRTITVAAQTTTTANILNSFYIPTATWRIGTWDGTPAGFLNADKISIMHPSDVRMSSWTASSNFVIGTNATVDWPLAQFMGVNNSQRITFTLTAAQAAQAQTLRIGITLGFAGGRDVIHVNAGQSFAWNSAIPTPATDLNSRGITRGTWRGPNQLYTYNIPASAFQVGTNTIDLSVVSGSYVAGQTFLSPNVVYDAIDLVPTSSVAAPVIASVTLSPLSSTVGLNGTKVFTAVARDSANNVVAANITWSATRGTIDANGNYIAPATDGNDTITATAIVTGTSGYSTSTSSTSAFSGNILTVASTALTVLGTIPVVTVPASGTPNPAPAGSSALSVLANDDGGEANLKYTWSVVGTPPSAVAFSANGTNASKNTTATFTADGVYNFLVTITDLSNNTRTSSVAVAATTNIAWYKANESSGATLSDSFGLGYNANLSTAGTGTYSFVAGRSGNALNLAASSSANGAYASLPTGVVNGLNNFTILSWVKLTSLDNWGRIFDFGTGTTNYMFLSPKSSTTSKPRFAIRTAAQAEQAIDSAVAVTTGVWFHIAVTLSGNTATLYINGVQQGINTGVTLRPLSLGATTANYIGKSQFSSDFYLNGAIDDFKIYGRALSAAEISAMATTALPAAPTGLTATAVAGGQVNLGWSAVSGATGYDIYRGTATGGPYVQIASTIAPSITYQDIGLAANLASGTPYYYVVSAENVGGEGARSTEANANVLPSLPSAPDPLTQVALSGGLNITWSAATNAATYNVSRATSAGGTFTTIATGLTATTYSDTGLTNGATYYYIVRSVNAAGGTDSAVTQGIPTDQLVRLKFDETTGTTADDATGHANIGTLTNGPLWSTGGKIAGAVSLDGVNDYVSLPTGVVAGVTNVTIATWFNFTSLTTWQRAFDFGTGTTAYMFFTPRSSTNLPRFSITTGGNTVEQVINGNAGLATGVWIHMAVTISGSVGTLYINGVQVGQNASMTLNPASLGSTTQNYLGHSQFSTDPYYTGKLDDFRIYSRALSAAEVNALVTPTATTVNVSPTSASLSLNGTRQFAATVVDQFGATMTGQSVTWTANGGSVSNTGLFTAPSSEGQFTVTATSGAAFGAATVDVVNATPSVATAAAASPSPVTGSTTSLSVLGGDDGGEAALTYTWIATSLPSGASAPGFSANGTNAAKSSTATFSKAGAYGLQVTITDTLGASTTSSVNVNVEQTPTSLTLSPLNPSIVVAGLQQFTASVIDQFSGAIASPSLSWNITGAGNSISATGLATAGLSPGNYTVSATSGTATNNTTLSVTAPTFSVTSTADTGPGSLYQAIVDANNGPAVAGAIVFNVNGAIQPSSPLPNLTRAETLNLASGNVSVGTANGATFGEFTSLTLTGAGMLTITGNQTHSSAATINVGEGGLTLNSDVGANVSISASAPVTFGSSQHLASLSLTGAKATLGGSGKLLAVSSLALDANSTLDMASNKMIVHATSGTLASVLANVTSYVRTGYLAGWSALGHGIVSSTAAADTLHITAIGTMSNANGPGQRVSTFASEAVTSTDILLKYTYYGDANLDGVLNGGDYALTDNGFNFGLTGFGNGDANNDGAITAADYALLDNAFNNQGGPLTSSALQPLTLQLTPPPAITPNSADAALAAYLANAQSSSSALDTLLAGSSLSSNPRRNWRM